MPVEIQKYLLQTKTWESYTWGTPWVARPGNSNSTFALLAPKLQPQLGFRLETASLHLLKQGPGLLLVVGTRSAPGSQTPRAPTRAVAELDEMPGGTCRGAPGSGQAAEEGPSCP